jgi:putative DNA primase/helicase
MDFFTLFKERQIETNASESPYQQNDIGTARLFYDLHKGFIRYVIESKTWYVYNGRMWVKDEGAFHVMELCKTFTLAYAQYAKLFEDGSPENKAYIKYAAGLTGRKRREGILSDARSIQPMKLTAFDSDRGLFNCANGTFSLSEMVLLPHNPTDYITKQADVKYVPDAVCERWERFIAEIMCGDMETARFLQKALGYCLSGGTSLECFFILHGSTTRNGKSTLIGAVEHILADYARSIQPQTLSRRPNDGAAPSPDIARLKGARLVNMPEPEKGLELNIALIKQLTGGDTYTGRFLHENPVEYKPEFKIFINTNHLPRTADNTVFTSDRVKLIPFNRHFQPHEQDIGLKKLFRKSENKSGILNWLIEGYRLLTAEGLTVPEGVAAAIAEYQQDGDIFGLFCADALVPAEGNRLKTSILYERYKPWAKLNGYKPVCSQDFVAELRRRYGVEQNGHLGNFIEGYTAKK